MFAPPGLDFAVVIGINQYRDPGLYVLPGPPNDAEAFIKWLKKKGNLHSQRILAKTEEVHYSHVLELFNRLLDIVPPAGGRRLYIFIAGHGFGESIKESVVYTSDYSPHAEVCFDMVKTADALRYSGRFKEVIVFVDCCRQMRRFPATGIPLKLDQQLPAAEHFYCFACVFGEPAREVQLGSKARGVFSFGLLRALNGEDTSAVDSLGRVTAYSLVRHLSDKMALNGGRPDFDPRDNPSLQKLVLASGLTPPDRSLEVELAGSSAGIGLFRGSDLTRLDWKPTEIERGRLYRVDRRDDSVIIVTSPDVPPDHPAVRVQKAVGPNQKRIVI